MPRLDDEQITAALCKAFRETYEAANITQGQIASALDVDQPAVSRWARGERRPPLWALPEVERICRVPRGHILRMAGLVDDDLDLRAAIRTERTLSPDERGALLLVYDQFRQRVESDPAPSPDPEPATVSEFPSPPPDPWHDLVPDEDDEDEARIWSMDWIHEDSRRQVIWEGRRNRAAQAAKAPLRRRSNG